MPTTRRSRRAAMRNAAGCIESGKAADMHLCYSQAGDTRAAAAQGLLQHMPSSWLHQLIAGLPREDKLRLFRVCRQLAHQVICSAKVQLSLLWEKRCPDKVEAAQKALHSLLDEGREIVVDLCHSGKTPYPFALGNLVTELAVSWPQDEDIDTVQPFAIDQVSENLTNLKRLCWGYCDRDELLAPLSRALRAGHLQRLKTLDLMGVTWLKRPGPTEKTREVLAKAVGSHITALRLNETTFLSHIHLFYSLQRLELMHCRLQLGAAKSELFEHPRLRYVEIRGCSIREKCTHYNCHWHTLTIRSGNVAQLLARLPLTGVTEVQIIDFDFRYIEPRFLHQLADIVEQCRHNLSLMPVGDSDTATISLLSPPKEVLSLVQQIRHACKLIIHRPEPGFVSAFWRFLPPCVWGLSLQGCYSLDWSSLWRDLPETVTFLNLADSAAYNDLLILVRTAPAHVSILKACSARKLAANLFANAVPHLKLHVYT